MANNNEKNANKNIVQKDYQYEDEFDDYTIEERLINIEKKSNIILFLMVIVLILVVITMIKVYSSSNDMNTTNNSNNNSVNNSSSTSGYSTADFKEIKATDIKTESKNETIVIMVGRQGCGYCASYAPTITQVAKDFGITVRYIDLDKIIDGSTNPATVTDEESFTTLYGLTGDGEWADLAESHVGSTPLTLIVKNNKIIGGLAQADTAANVEAAFKAAGLSK